MTVPGGTPYLEGVRDSLRFVVLCCSVGTLLAACGNARRGGGTADAGGTDGASDARADAPAFCRADGDCDDGLDCTVDRCGVGNVCRNEPIDALCPDGQRCLQGVGCAARTRCERDADCDDGDPCNGAETCAVDVGTCLPGTPLDCDDGDPCTDDSCDPGRGACRYEPNGRCDGGAGDGGEPAPPFDPTMHYAGTFLVAPAPSLGCGMASYGFGSVRFERTADALRVYADWMTLEQRPAPEGPDFDVSYVNGSCSTMRLRGTFSNANEFSGRWTATMAAGCSACPNQAQDVAGVRTE